ncbi:MAG: orotidine-5'-phosphate decarboxylase [Bifidobacteriaceae bacterium]|jgi:orotidine-5'-phosphate decarboxylase|nr:orotidine-5'-phosphate decarboxylase [Bifidobacteriaceae bacterium]
MDRLIDAIAATDNPSIVGLDPTPALLPEPLLEPVRSVQGVARARALAESYLKFNTAIIDAITGIVPAVKPQIAMYEALGVAGVETYVRTTEYAQQHGLYVLGDVKRGDIGSTAAAYAAHLSGMPVVGSFSEESSQESIDRKDGAEKTAEKTTGVIDLWHEDAVTVNPYLGVDGILPFVEAASATDKDIFVLVRTSNPSSSQLQTLNAEGKAVADHVGDLVEQWGSETQGSFGYSRVGAVVGATHPREGARLRESMPHTFFLVPGFGAQGGSAKDVASMFDASGSGAIVNSSRGIIGAWKKGAQAHDADAGTVEEALDIVGRSARLAALAMRDSITKELKERNDH